MPSIARVSEGFRGWVARSESARGYLGFVAVFFGIWAAYDLCDLALGGTAGSYWLVYDAERTLKLLRALQWALMACELAAVALVLSRRGPRWGLGLAILGAFVLRGIEAFRFFGLNDFYYYTVTAFLLLQFWASQKSTEVAAWPRDVARVQTAWIYLATATLKLNPAWLSGDHLWVRHQYLIHALHWPVPGWLAGVLAQLPVNRGLALAGATGEMLLGLLLLLRAPRWLCVSLAAAMHTFAALALNVWFFGASMIAQVFWVSKRVPNFSTVAKGLGAQAPQRPV